MGEGLSSPGGPPGADAAARARLVARLRGAGCVFAEDEAALLLAASDDGRRLERLVARRVAGEPLEQVLGWAEFRGLRVRVAPGVFVPRRRTALLVTRALALLGVGAVDPEDGGAPSGRAGATGHGRARRPVVVDLCCGTGALGMALAGEAAAAGLSVELHAADVDAAAVACAAGNLAGVGAVHAGDLFDALPLGLRGRVDVLLANVPYVPSREIVHLPPEARDHEARVALDGGPDGLDVLRRVVAGAAHWLARGGSLLSEVSEAQLDAAVSVLRGAGLDARPVHDDATGATGVIGSRPEAGPS
ncbi:methyltransferase [Cellulosimicrobium arenosum]|uniref:Methyltransferase n=1 Tax=Cellulosimicrobium arenosum TaxID=2708133 RepID=A0A927J060_9MICO|nr:methyltransferase [Cellulosimicrobium arenosum]